MKSIGQQTSDLILSNHSMAKVNQQPQHTMRDGERVDRKEFSIESNSLINWGN